MTNARSDALPPLATNDPVLAALQDRLTSTDATVRRLALIELAEHEDEACTPPWLIHALQDHDADVRAEAAARLAWWESPAAVEALAHSLLDGVAAVRAAAAQSLSELKDAASGLALLKWLDAPSRASHEAGIEAESGRDEHAVQAFVQASVLRAVRELRLPESLAPALKAAASSHARVRLEAVGVLGWLKQSDALPVLARLAVLDEDTEVRRAAVGSLGFAAQPSVQTALLKALEDSAWQVREEAATTLGKLKLSEAVDALVAGLQDGHWQVRLRATRALGQLKARRATLAVVASALTHASANLRKEAAIALGEIGDPAALPALEAASHDSDPEVRKTARLAVSLISAGAMNPGATRP